MYIKMNSIHKVKTHTVKETQAYTHTQISGQSSLPQPNKPQANYYKEVTRLK